MNSEMAYSNMPRVRAASVVTVRSCLISRDHRWQRSRKNLELFYVITLAFIFQENSLHLCTSHHHLSRGPTTCCCSLARDICRFLLIACHTFALRKPQVLFPWILIP